MEYTLASAATATGLGKTTVFRAIKKGRLSARRADDGSYRIDASELARAFPPVAVEEPGPSPWKDRQQAETVSEAGGTDLAVLRVRFEMAEMRARMLEGQLAREQELADQTRSTVEDLRARLDRAEERVLALSAPPIQPAPLAPESAVEEPRKAAMGEAAPRASRSLLARLLGF